MQSFVRLNLNSVYAHKSTTLHLVACVQTLELEESLFLCMYRVACIDKRLPCRAGSAEVQYTHVLHFFDPLLFPLFFLEPHLAIVFLLLIKCLHGTKRILYLVCSHMSFDSRYPCLYTSYVLIRVHLERV